MSTLLGGRWAAASWRLPARDGVPRRLRASALAARLRWSVTDVSFPGASVGVQALPGAGVPGRDAGRRPVVGEKGSLDE